MAISESTDSTISDPSVSLYSSVSKDTVMLKTAIATVAGDSGNSMSCNLLFDDGSQRTFITEKTARILDLVPFKRETLNMSTFGSKSRKVHHLDVVKLRVTCIDKTMVPITAVVVPEITQPLSMCNDYVSIPEFSGMNFANHVHSAEPIKIEILVSSDHYYDFILNDIVRSKSGPVAISSKLGYLVCGPTGVCADHLVSALSVLSSLGGVEYMNDFWALENIGITPPGVDSSRSEFLENYHKNSIEKGDDMYVAKLPWRENHPELATNYSAVLNRTRTTVRRLAQSPEMLKIYSEIIDDQVSQDFIEKVPIEDVFNSSTKHYLAHHAVFRDSATTPIRIVFDCSFSTKGNPSLYDCLDSGPSLLNEITYILMRFRFHNVGLSADIEKAFLQVGLHTQDRDVTRFLWLTNPDDPESEFEVYHFKRVLFGCTSSPFILNSTILFHLQNNVSTVTDDLLRNIYVDNILTSVNSESEAIHYYTESRKVMSDGHFNLRSWATNCKKLCELASIDGALEKSTSVNSLGIHWSTDDDLISLKPKSVETDVDKTSITKRVVVSNMTKIYDPLGLFSPVTVKAKIFAQLLWKHSFDWDVPLPTELSDEWLKIASELGQVPNVQLPRCYFESNTKDTPLELHTFADASKQAYGAVSYLKCGNECSLIMSKSRVSPVTELTIPRLELVAALIAARLTNHIVDSLKPVVSTIQVHMYTDSQIVLSWLQSSKKLPEFVSNRVVEINSLVKTNSWSYCQSAQNPADILSRGCNISTLTESRLWFHGPKWLVNGAKPVNTLPVSLVESPSNNNENVPSKAIDNIMSNNCVMKTDRFSSVTRLLRVTVLVLRFIGNCKAKVSHKAKVVSPITAAELESAEIWWIKRVQRFEYTEVREKLLGHNNFRLPIVNQLQLYLDEQGIIRCKGRLQNALIPDSTKNPILLPKWHQFTRLIVRRAHCTDFHGGVNYTIAKLRQSYWIPQIRQLVKNVLRKCIVCRKVSCRPFFLPDPPPLPMSRITEVPCFSNTGLDYLGPLFVKSNDGQVKCHVCLFTCAVSRAVHLEVVRDLTTEQFILAFRRFSSRRSLPRRVISDNASTFVCANDVLIQILSSENFSEFSANQGFTWQFITKRAPWHGGFYERLVALVKTALKKVLGRTITYDELAH